jgi:hypothetical protein
MKTDFWDVALCNLIEIALMEAARTSETLENFYETIRRNSLEEDSHLV